jgi:hypothetical protein
LTFVHIGCKFAHWFNYVSLNRAIRDILRPVGNMGKKKSKGIVVIHGPTKDTTLVVEEMILTIRGQKVVSDSALAHLYGVETKRLNEQVRRNADRFPSDFMFRLTAEEVTGLRSQFATSNKVVGKDLRSQTGTSKGRGGRR